MEFAKRQQAYQAELASSRSALEKLAVLLETHFRAVGQDIAVGRILVREHPAPGGTEENQITLFLQGVPSLIQTLLDQAAEAGEIGPLDTELVAAAIFGGAVQGVTFQAVFTESESKRKEILAAAPRGG